MKKIFNLGSVAHVSVQGQGQRRSVGRSVRPSPIRVRSITPLLMEGFPSNLNDTFTCESLTEIVLVICLFKLLQL